MSVLNMSAQVCLCFNLYFVLDPTCPCVHYDNELSVRLTNISLNRHIRVN